ncbi:MAG: CoA pyrophosphatase [Alphaproteobacteria bacterium]
MKPDLVRKRLREQGRVGRRVPSAEGPVRRGDHDLDNVAYRYAGKFAPAAVLVPLVRREAGLTVLLTQRTNHLPKHAGQISFPGGKSEPHDESLVETALREAEEEIGLDRSLVEVAGQLDIYETRSGFEITPVVGLVEPKFSLKPDPHEVADVFEVPLSFVLDPANHQRDSRELEGLTRVFYVLPYPDRYIWGATAGMLVNLYEVLSGRL